MHVKKMEYLVSSVYILYWKAKQSWFMLCFKGVIHRRELWGLFYLTSYLSGQSMSYSHCMGNWTKYETGHVQACKCIQSPALPFLQPYGVRKTGSSLDRCLSSQPCLFFIHMDWDDGMQCERTSWVVSLPFRNAGFQAAFTLHSSALSLGKGPLEWFTAERREEIHFIAYWFSMKIT